MEGYPRRRRKKIDMNSVPRKMLMYCGAIPLTSFEKGKEPAAIWFPIVAKMKLAPVKNFAARLSNFAMTAGMYHSNLPQICECAEVTKIGVSALGVPIIGNAKYW